MTKATLMIALCVTLFWARTALATPTPQQQCDYARVTAWKTYVSCVEHVVAKDAKGIVFDEFAAFAKCRHAYFKKWSGFQTKAALAGSTCIGPRFTDNGDQTVTDNLTTLVWEKKDNRDGMVNYSDRHDADNSYTWGSGAENGVWRLRAPFFAPLVETVCNHKAPMTDSLASGHYTGRMLVSGLEPVRS